MLLDKAHVARCMPILLALIICYNSLDMILVTGGTGFIGRALITELLPYNPVKIVIFSRDEVKHYRMQQDFKDSRIQSVIGDFQP